MRKEKFENSISLSVNIKSDDSDDDGVQAESSSSKSSSDESIEESQQEEELKEGASEIEINGQLPRRLSSVNEDVLEQINSIVGPGL